MYKEILRNFKIVHVYEDTNFVYNGGSNLKIVEIFLIFPHLSFLPLFDDSRLKFSISTPLVSSCICYKYLFTIRAEAEVGGFTRVLSKGLDPASSGKITLKVHSLPFRRDKANELWTPDSIPERREEGIMPRLVRYKSWKL